MTINVVGAIAGDKDTRDARADGVIARHEIAVVVYREGRRKRLRIRHVTDGDENTLAGDITLRTRRILHA